MQKHPASAEETEWPVAFTLHVTEADALSIARLRPRPHGFVMLRFALPDGKYNKDWMYGIMELSPARQHKDVQIGDMHIQTLSIAGKNIDVQATVVQIVREEERCDTTSVSLTRGSIWDTEREALEKGMEYTSGPFVLMSLVFLRRTFYAYFIPKRSQENYIKGQNYAAKFWNEGQEIEVAATIICYISGKEEPCETK